MRLINADELMEHVWRDKLDSRELIAKMVENAPTVKEIPTRIPLEVWERLVSAAPEWIPVSERLPEDEQEVLITYKINVKNHVWSAIWDKLHGRFYDKEYISYISLNYVTAWMPLPSHYEGEDK